jgi:hypothetical protein
MSPLFVRLFDVLSDLPGRPGDLRSFAAAAVRALLDDGWSRGELLGLLARKRGPDATVEARAALRLSRAPEPTRAVERWEARYPEDGRPPTSDRFWYALHGGCEQRLRDRMAELRERVERLRPSKGTPGANVQPLT